RRLTHDDIALFAALSGDVNPTHMEFAAPNDGDPGFLGAHSMWAGVLVSAVLGTRLPGPGTCYVSQTLQFHRQIVAGDSLTTMVTVTDKKPSSKTVILDCRCTDENGVEVMSGVAQVKAPVTKYRGKLSELPEISVRRHEKYERLIARCQGLAPVATAV